MGDAKIGEISYSDSSKEILEILKCNYCGSLYYAGATPVVGYENKDFSENFWIHYAQLGAGIVDMLKPLFFLGERFNGKILDIGCGFGYVVDFVNKMGYGHAVGLEMADYGSIGGRLLGAPIYRNYYSNCKEIEEIRYDIVYSCEVLEHVPDPRSFILEISKALTENGILVLTTPSSAAVGDDEKSFDAIAALCPYHHFFLSSREALETMLKKCEFKNVKVLDTGNRLFAWASNGNLPVIKEIIAWEDYYKYLEMLSRNQDVNISCGALLRQFKSAVANGVYGLAGEALEKLKESAEKIYGLDLDYPDTKRYVNMSSSAKEFMKNPIWFGSALLHAAIYSGIVECNLRKKARLLDAACQILLKNASRYEYSQFVNDALHDHRHALRELRVVYLEIINNELGEKDQVLDSGYRAILLLNKISLKTIMLYVKAKTYRIIKNKFQCDLIWWRNNWRLRVSWKMLYF